MSGARAVDIRVEVGSQELPGLDDGRDEGDTGDVGLGCGVHDTEYAEAAHAAGCLEDGEAPRALGRVEEGRVAAVRRVDDVEEAQGDLAVEAAEGRVREVWAHTPGEVVEHGLTGGRTR
jgi:hypothetical protein